MKCFFLKEFFNVNFKRDALSPNKMYVKVFD